MYLAFARVYIFWNPHLINVFKMVCGYSQLNLTVNATTENSLMNVVRAWYFVLRDYDKLFIRE